MNLALGGTAWLPSAAQSVPDVSLQSEGPAGQEGLAALTGAGMAQEARGGIYSHPSQDDLADQGGPIYRINQIFKYQVYQLYNIYEMYNIY